MGIPRARLRAYCTHVPPPSSARWGAEWGKWVDGVATAAPDALRTDVPAQPPPGAPDAAWLAWYDAFMPPPPPPRPPPGSVGAGAAHGGDSGDAGCTIGETALRGITLRQLEALYARACALCASHRWTSTAPGRSDVPLAPGSITLYDLNRYLLLPETEARDCAMVELIAARAQPPQWFASHWWGEPVADFIECLRRHAYDRGLSADTSYWVCAYANRQHSIGGELGGGVESSPFVRALHLADGMVSIVDGGGAIFTRVWCAYETHVSVIERGAAFLHDIYTAAVPAGAVDAKGAAVRAVGYVDGFAVDDAPDGEGYDFLKAQREKAFPRELIERASGFELANADASVQSDKEAILAAVGAASDAVDATVRTRYAQGLLPFLLRRGPHFAQMDAFCATLARARVRKLSAYCDQEPSDAALEKLVAALPPTVERVAVVGHGPAGTAGLGARVAAGQLRELVLTHCKLRKADVEALADAACHPGSRLHTLCLRYNEWRSHPAPRIGAEMGRVLGSATAPGALRVLRLWANELGDEGVGALAAGLRGNAALEELDVSANDVQLDGARALGAALALNRRLQTLNLISNNLGDKGAAALAEGVGGNGALRTLLLADNRLGDRGARACAEMLSHNRALTELDLSKNEELGAAGVRALSAVLGGATAAPPPARGADEQSRGGGGGTDGEDGGQLRAQDGAAHAPAGDASGRANRTLRTLRLTGIATTAAAAAASAELLEHWQRSGRERARLGLSSS